MQGSDGDIKEGRKMKKKVVIIGAGFGGLSAAVRLAHAGFQVEVYDRQAHVGGKAGSLRMEGYRFDTGPSLITLREVFSQVFEETGRRMEDYLEFVPLETICTYYFDDGTKLSARGNPAAFAEEVARNTEDSAAGVENYLAYSRGIYDKTSELFLWNSLHRPSTYLKPEVWRGIFRKGKLDARRTMDEANRDFFTDPRMVQLFNRYATYNGSDPYQVPATLNIIPHVEYGMGAYASARGINDLPEALKKVAEELGVVFHLKSEVERLVVEGRCVRGIAGSFGVVKADIVISNVDARRTYETLLEDPEAPYAKRYAALEPSSSGMVFFWGMKSTYPELTVNNIFFSGDYPAEFRALFSELRCPEDPTVYVNISSKVSPDDAPRGGENWFVLINAPRNAGQDWKAEVVRVRRAVISRLSAVLGKDVETDISVEKVLTPDQIEKETGSYYGSLYGISSNTKTAAFLRHPASTGRYRGLYFCGGSVHPGGGMPLALLSGKIAADLIKEKEG